MQFIALKRERINERLESVYYQLSFFPSKLRQLGYLVRGKPVLLRVREGVSKEFKKICEKSTGRERADGDAKAEPASLLALRMELLFQGEGLLRFEEREEAKEEAANIEKEVEDSQAEKRRNVEEDLEHHIESLGLTEQNGTQKEAENHNRTKIVGQKASSGMGTPERLDGEEPTEVKRAGVSGEEGVVLEHDGNQHVSHDQGITEHEEDDHGLGEEVGAHHTHIDIAEIGSNESVERAGPSQVDREIIHRHTENEAEDVKENELEGNEGEETEEDVGEDDDELGEERENSKAEDNVEVEAKQSDSKHSLKN